MTDSTMADLVAAWQAWEAKPSGEHIADAKENAITAFAEAHGLPPLFVRSEMARLRRRRPQPDHAACLALIIEGSEWADQTGPQRHGFPAGA